MNSARRFPTIERLEDRIAPATFMVTNLLDDGSDGSLRKAVNDSNTSDGPDTILFKVTGTIVLGGSLGLDQGIKLKGPGSAKLAIDGGGADRVFLFSNIPADDPISVTGLTLKNGATSGQGRLIYSTEPTTLSDVKLIGNPNANFDLTNGAGLFVGTNGNVTIKNCEFTGNAGAGSGGGAYLSTTGTGAKVAISASMFSNNESSGAGGGLFVDLAGTGASLTVDHGTFDGNTGMQAGTGTGGAVQVQAGGGGLIVIKNSTFTGNRSGDSGNSGGGGIFQTGGRLLVQGSLFSANAGRLGGAIDATGAAEVSVQKSIFTHNTAAVGGAIATSGVASATIKGSQFSYNQSASDPGGAINFATTAAWTISGSKFTGNVAINGGAVYADSGIGMIKSGTSFRGNHATFYGGALELQGTADVTISSGVFSANTAQDGGAIHVNAAKLTVQGARFSTNSVATNGTGGAIRDDAGVVLISSCTFDHNFADFGGAIFTYGDFTSLKSTYRDNVSTYNGGAITTPAVGIHLPVVIKGGTATGNRALTDNGGAFFLVSFDSVTVEKVTFLDNHAALDGGGLYLDATLAALTGDRFQNNSASHGGGVSIYAGSATLTGVAMTGNFASVSGGGLYLDPVGLPTVMLIHPKISANDAPLNPDTFGI